MMEQDDALTIGTVGLWKGQLGETKVGVLLDSDTLQLYKKTRYGMVPSGLPTDTQSWSLEEVIEDYGYEQRGNRLYLVF